MSDATATDGVIRTLRQLNRMTIVFCSEKLLIWREKLPAAGTCRQVYLALVLESRKRALGTTYDWTTSQSDVFKPESGLHPL